MRWKILSECVRKSPSEDVSKNFVFHVQSISVPVIWFDFSEVIWLIFKTHMKDDLMQYELSY